MSRDLGRAPVLHGQRPQRGRRRPRGPGGGGSTPWALIAAVATIVALAAIAWRGRAVAPEAAAPAPPVPTADAEAATVPAEDWVAEPELAAVESEDQRRAAEADLAAAIVAEDPPAPPAARVRYGPEDPFRPVNVRLARGETLVQALIRGGMPRGEANNVVAALGDQVDFRRLRPGDHFDGTLWLGERLIEGTFQQGVLDRYRLQRPAEEAALVAAFDPLPLVAATEPVRGTVASSLFQAIYEAGESPNLIMAFVDLFSWDFDFAIETRPGDRFEMLVEKRYVEDRFYDYGPILAGRYTSGTREFEACWYRAADDAEVAGYFHPDGSSVKRAFLRAPLSYTRISSGYTLSRLHPVLHVRRPHRGIDYAAPTGTPVYAVGDGLVIGAGWMGGAGQAIRVQHPNGWITSYSHLHKILVRRGQRVQQGQTIGQVGSTGHSTGPHLDYRITIGGNFVNPLQVEFPSGDPVPNSHRAAFQQSCAASLQALDRAAGTHVVAAADPAP